jgi:hypothetical protein
VQIGPTAGNRCLDDAFGFGLRLIARLGSLGGLCLQRALHAQDAKFAEIDKVGNARQRERHQCERAEQNCRNEQVVDHQSNGAPPKPGVLHDRGCRH